jgi:hypothetical protein
MSLQPKQALSLRDRQDRDLGHVVIEQLKDDLVFGRFSPGKDFPAVEQLFADYVECANEQLLSHVGELDARIAALVLRLCADEDASLPSIFDVQIGAGVITFRTRPAARKG